MTAKPITEEDCLLFVDDIRLDATRRNALYQGTDLLSEAVKSGLVETFADADTVYFKPRMRDARQMEWIDWRDAQHDRGGYDLMNARDFRVTDKGARRAQEIRGFPRFMLVGSTLEQDLQERRWLTVLDTFNDAETQMRAKHWDDAVGKCYKAVESALKYALEQAGIDHAEGNALKKLSAIASQHGLFPKNYQALFGYLDSIRSPQSHGSGGQAKAVTVGPHEALLAMQHARSLVQYLARPSAE